MALSAGLVGSALAADPTVTADLDQLKADVERLMATNLELQKRITELTRQLQTVREEANRQRNHMRSPYWPRRMLARTPYIRGGAMFAPIKPAMHFIELLLVDVEPAPEAPHNAQTERAAYEVAASDAAPTAGHCRRQRSGHRHFALRNQVTAEDQEGFVGNGQADDAENQDAKQRTVAIDLNPVKNRLHRFHDSAPGALPLARRP